MRRDREFMAHTEREYSLLLGRGGYLRMRCPRGYGRIWKARGHTPAADLGKGQQIARKRAWLKAARAYYCTQVRYQAYLLH